MDLELKHDIRETLEKPSVFIKLVMESILHFKDDDNFGFDMGTYGEFDHNKGRCYGCAATCAIFYLTKEEPNEDNIEPENHPINGFTKDDVEDFEGVVDSFRSYEELAIGEVLDYFEIYDDPPKELVDYDFPMLCGYPSEEEINTFVKECNHVISVLEEHGY